MRAAGRVTPRLTTVRQDDIGLAADVSMECPQAWCSLRGRRTAGCVLAGCIAKTVSDVERGTVKRIFLLVGGRSGRSSRSAGFGPGALGGAANGLLPAAHSFPDLLNGLACLLRQVARPFLDVRVSLQLASIRLSVIEQTHRIEVVKVPASADFMCFLFSNARWALV
jgi:hypothetical protein